MNIKNLTDEFELEEKKIFIKQFEEILNEVKSVKNLDKTSSAVIEKAMIFVDKIHNHLENDDMSPRYFEVANQLLQTIIQSTALIGQNQSMKLENKFKKLRIEQKNKEIDIKKEANEIKKLQYTSENNQKGDNNIIITDRESILKFIEKNDTKDLE